jgi:ATP-binding cassette subfamily F protein 3
VILVSHDPHLVENVCDRLWLVADGSCVPYEGDLDDYRKLVVAQRKRERESTKQEARRNKNEKKSGGTATEKQAAKLEDAVRVLTEKKDEMENALAVASTSGDASQLVRLNKSYSQLQKELDDAEKALEAFIATL